MEKIVNGYVDEARIGAIEEAFDQPEEKEFCRVSKHRLADQVDCGAQRQDGPTCLTSKGYVSRST